MEGDGIGVEYLGKVIRGEMQRYLQLCDVTGKRQLLEYEIQDWKLFIDNTGEMSQAEVKIVFRRLVVDAVGCKLNKPYSQEH